MWYKVKDLTDQGFNKSQIRQATGLDRSTIRKYQKMEEDAFHSWIKQKRNLPGKLSQYQDYVKGILNKAPFLSAAQVEDRLKEHYGNLPDIHSKTVYNFVQNIRKKYDIPKPVNHENRIFEKLPDPPFGKEAQVDFGETWMQTKAGKRKKVYFFAISLSRSRYKYIYLTDKCFTSEIAVKAHHLAFEYFGGVPLEIIYDQDSVFIHDENLGDYLLTKAFSSFCKSQDFKAVFCRKADPQSKGKIENVVKYVKQNFLRGREYINIELLNTQAVSWLKRTANTKVHSSTRLVPRQQWEQEKEHLLPIKQNHHQRSLKPYKVRKDNTILYKSNFYTLPLGTYIDKQSTVLLEIKHQEVFVYTMSKELICSHKLSHEQGKTVRNTDHKRQKSQTLEIYQQQVLELFGQNDIAREYLQLLRKDKSRYYRDNLQYILKEHGDYKEDKIRESLFFCIENKVFNAKSVIDILNENHKERDVSLNRISSGPSSDTITTQEEDINIETSDINTYETLFN